MPLIEEHLWVLIAIPVLYLLAGIRIRIRAGPEENANGADGGRRGGRRGMNMARRLLAGGRSPVDLTDDEGRFRLSGVGSDTPWVVYGESDEYDEGWY